LQADNRPKLNYLLLSKQVNKKVCDKFGYNYLFLEIDNTKYNLSTKQYIKLYLVNEVLQNSKDDVLVFLDSDAWVQNGFYLNDMIQHLSNDANKHGCFSRDPYLRQNTFINSGSFILKINEFTKKMYSEIVDLFDTDLRNNKNNDIIVRKKNRGWCDQFYISNFVFSNKQIFNIFVPDILNTPIGKVIRHNWCKNDKMFTDMNEIINNDIISDNSSLDFETYYDNEPFPNNNRNTCRYVTDPPLKK